MSGEKKRKNDTHTLTHIDVGDLSFELRHFLYENNAQNPFLIEVPPLIMFFVKNIFYVFVKNVETLSIQAQAFATLKSIARKQIKCYFTGYNQTHSSSVC